MCHFASLNRSAYSEEVSGWSRWHQGEKGKWMEQNACDNPFHNEALAARYDRWYETPLGAVAHRCDKSLIQRLARPQAGERTPDRATATGHFALDLAKHGLKVTGCDSSESMLQVARAKDASLDWRRCQAASLPLADGVFDLVLSVTVLEFVPDPPRAMAEMYRVAAPGGRVVVGVLNARSPWAAMYRRQQEGPFRHAHFYTAKEFLELLGTYGPVGWNSAVFFGPSGCGRRIAPLLESLGQTFCKGRGALLVGRIDK